MLVGWGLSTRRGSIVVALLASATTLAVYTLLTLGSGAVSGAATGVRSTTGTGTLISTRTTRLGLVVVGLSKRTVYLFTRDTFKTSKCNSTCRKTWPRVLTTGVPRAGSGIKASRLSQTSAHQVTYYGHPLYYYAGDHRTAGNTRGQGLSEFGGRWWVVSPQGKAGTGTTVTKHSTPIGAAAAGPVGHPRTLYALSSDSSTHSTCTGSCAAAWPPLITTGRPHAGTGITASLLGTLVRPNGTRQVTYNGRALYYYAGDSAAGQDNGQCIFQGPGTWHLVNASGTINKTGCSSSTSSSSSTTSTSPPPPACTHPTNGALTTGSATLTHTTGTTAGVLLAGDGCTVYMFQADETAPVSSHCTATACVTQWPPVTTATVSGFSASGGAMFASIGTIPRGTGYQLTYNGYPLYWYGGDHTPNIDPTPASGNGNGAFAFNEYWYALNGSDGTKICGNSSFCH